MDSKSESHTRFRFRYLWIRFRLKSTRFRLQIRFHYTWFRIRNQIRIQIRPLIPTPDSESPQVWLTLAVKPLKCAEGARHDLLLCPDCQNISKWGEKCMSNWQQTTIFIFTFTCMMLLCHQSSCANHRFPNCLSWSLDGSENVFRHLVIKTCTASSYLARHGNCAAL